MIDLHHGQGPRGWREGPGHRGELLTRPTGAFAALKRVVSPKSVESAAHRIIRSYIFLQSIGKSLVKPALKHLVFLNFFRMV